MIRSKSINKWGDQRGEKVFVYYYPQWNNHKFVCKGGDEDTQGVLGFGDTGKMAIENYVYRKHYFDGGAEKYYPFVTV